MYEHPEALLKPYAKMLNEFGTKYGLEQEICRHDMPNWSFYFSGKRGGHVSVQVNEKKEVFVRKFWPRRFFVFGKTGVGIKIDNPAETLEVALIEAVKDVFGLKPEKPSQAPKDSV